MVFKVTPPFKVTLVYGTLPQAPMSLAQAPGSLPAPPPKGNLAAAYANIDHLGLL